MSDPFAAALDKILMSACGPEVVAAAERAWPKGLWDVVDASGIALVGVRDSRGGADVGWAEIAAVLRTSARFAAPIPLAETIVARRLADQADLDLPEGPISVALGDEVTLDARDRLSGPVRRVPWARDAAAPAVVDAAARAGAELRAVAAAKVRTATAASEGARLAHQIHGAIGVTYEHQLHNLTTRLWSWRDEYGSEAFWARVLGARLSAGGGEGFWDLLLSSGTEAAGG